jgi:hypothetical protein
LQNANLPTDIKDGLESFQWTKKIRAASHTYLKLMFEVNQYEDQIMKDKHKPKEKNQGNIVLESQYELDSDKSLGYMADTVPMNMETGKAIESANIPGCCYTLDSVKEFIYKLPTNILFTMGFHLHTNNDKYCFYPCSNSVMKAWRTLNDIDFKVPHSEICKDTSMHPEVLVQHLTSKAQNHDWLHKGCLYYIQYLYNFYWNKDLHHKGIYIHQSHPKYTETFREQNEKLVTSNAPPLS